MKNFFTPIVKAFDTIVKGAVLFTKMTATATGILGFARGIGSSLGKVFLPITILISAFDFITGLIERVHGRDPYKRGSEEAEKDSS